MSIVRTTDDNLVSSDAAIGFFCALGMFLLSIGCYLVWGFPGILIGSGTTAFFIFLGLVAEKVAAKVINHLP